MLGGVVSMLMELGRDLNLALSAGSIERARQAAADADMRDEMRVGFADPMPSEA